MKEIMQETALKLTKSQLQTVLNDHILQENGINDLFTMLINGLMFSGRETFLSESDLTNKANGYRSAKRSGIVARLELKIPRDRIGVFKPLILGLLDKQEERIKELCFELYGKGLTTRQIENVVENLYGNTSCQPDADS